MAIYQIIALFVILIFYLSLGLQIGAACWLHIHFEGGNLIQKIVFSVLLTILWPLILLLIFILDAFDVIKKLCKRRK